MSKYNKYERKRPEARHKIHPIWTGIGCLMIIIVPIMSWAAAQLLVDLGHEQGWGIMYSLGGNLALPAVLYTTPYISPVADFISSIPDLSALVLFFLVILLILSGVLSFVYSIVYRVIGPPRYTSEDEPAPRIKIKRYTR